MTRRHVFSSVFTMARFSISCLRIMLANAARKKTIVGMCPDQHAEVTPPTLRRLSLITSDVSLTTNPIPLVMARRTLT